MTPTINLTTGDNIILVPTDGGTRVISPRRIIRIQSISSYSKLFFSDGSTLVVAKVLLYFENMLLQHEFIRVHRTHLVNKHYMQTILMGEGAKILLENGELLSISRRKRKAVFAMLGSPGIMKQA
jgi:two-component system, LytTR family, response regulator